MSLVASRPRYATIGDLLSRLGDIPADRVRYDPFPGQATKRDLIRLHGKDGKLYELVDKTLVEKPRGRPESYLAAQIITVLSTFVDDAGIGFVTGPDDLAEILPGIVRGPDVSFVSWAKRPDKTPGRAAIGREVPDLAVEVVSPSNTKKEIARKLDEYFRGGVRLVWVIDHRKGTADIYTAPDAATTIDSTGTLDGADVVPGFQLPLKRLFGRTPPDEPKRRRKGK